MAGARRSLTVFDRLLIELRLWDGWGVRPIARELDRSPGMVSDEINRHGGAAAYQAQAAAGRADAGPRPAGADAGHYLERAARGIGRGGRAGRRRHLVAILRAAGRDHAPKLLGPCQQAYIPMT